MTKIRDEELHKLRHHRKAGAHTPKRRPDPRAYDMAEWLDELEREWDATADTEIEEDG